MTEISNIAGAMKTSSLGSDFPTKKESFLDKALNIFMAKEPQSFSNAEYDGESVAVCLNGPTDNMDTDFTITIFANQRPEDMIGFLSGYEHGKARIQDHFFKQLYTETDFPNKHRHISELGNKFLVYLKKNGGLPEDIAKLEKILQNKKFTKAQAKEMDKIVANYIK